MPNKDGAQQLYEDYLVELWNLYCQMEQVEFSLRDLQLEYKFDRYELAQIRNDAAKRRTSYAERSTNYVEVNKRKNKKGGNYVFGE